MFLKTTQQKPTFITRPLSSTPLGKMQLLLFSNSSMAGTKYMEWLKPSLKDFLSRARPINVTEILFIPFAAVTIPWDRYVERIRDSLPEYKIINIHTEKNMIESIKNAKAIMIGGGNTFHLLFKLYEYNLLDTIRDRVLKDSIPYIGWSAGAVVAGPDIGTTNDMPIIFPPSDKALNFVPYNINPHFSEYCPPNFQGETRIDRLNECAVIKQRPLVAISEGIGIRVHGPVHAIVAPKLPEESRKFKDDRVVKVWNHAKGVTEVESLPLECEILTELRRIQKVYTEPGPKLAKEKMEH